LNCLKLKHNYLLPRNPQNVMKKSNARPIQGLGQLASSIANAPNIPIRLLCSSPFSLLSFLPLSVLRFMGFWHLRLRLDCLIGVLALQPVIAKLQHRSRHEHPWRPLQSNRHSLRPLYRIWPDITWPSPSGLVCCFRRRFPFPDRPPSVAWQTVVCLTFALAYYLHPAVHNTLLWQYHDLVLASGLFMALIWSYVKDRPRLYSVILVLLLACREDMPITLAAFGIVSLLEKRWRYGLWTVAISVIWWLVVTRIAMPYFNGVGYFRASSGGLAVILSNLANPSFYLARSAIRKRWTIYGKCFCQPACSVWSHQPSAASVPALAANVLIASYNTVLTYHYSVTIMLSSSGSSGRHCTYCPHW